LERLARHPFALVDEAEEDVLGPDVVVVEEACLLLGQDHDPAGPVGEPFEHGIYPFMCCSDHDANGARPGSSRTSLLTGCQRHRGRACSISSGRPMVFALSAERQPAEGFGTSMTTSKPMSSAPEATGFCPSPACAARASPSRHAAKDSSSAHCVTTK